MRRVYLVEEVLEVEVYGFDAQFAGLDARQIQNIVNQ